MDAVDTKRANLVLLTGNISVGSQVVTAGNPSITVYDTKRRKVAATWDLEQRLPGFYPLGITYSRADDRLYAVGEFSGSTYLANSIATFGSKAVGPVSSVVAFSPVTGKPIWVRPVPQCQELLNSLNTGGLVARSRSRNALYFSCVTGATASGNTYPGEAGLVRLTIDPKAATSTAAAQFPLDYFPISGQYFNGAAEGIATFDYRDDRFFLQSLAPKTPGAWVFDGRLSPGSTRGSATSTWG
jgi:hypothetical protein